MNAFTSGPKRNYYSKGDVIVYRLYRDGRPNPVFGASVKLLIYGDAFWQTYTTGDNTGLVATDSMKNFIQRAAAKCAPPLRSAHEREALRLALFRGDIDMVGSDHSPCAPELKDRAGFFEIRGGIAGVQSTLPVLFSLGVPPEQVATLTAANSAKRFRIAHKGSTAAGFHADLALVNLNTTTELRAETLLQKHRVSPYVGEKLTGAIRATFRRDELICSDGEITVRTPGKFVRPGKGS